MMGMANWLQWTSNFIKNFLFLLVVTFLMTLLLCPPFPVSLTLPYKRAIASLKALFTSLETTPID